LAVPRVWEKFEERIKEIGSQSNPISKAISGWSRGIGYENSLNKVRQEPSPFGYSMAKMLVLGKVKKALGLEKAKAYFFGAAPLKKSTRDFFLSLDMPLGNCYGMSEVSGPATMSYPNNMDYDKAGKKMPGTDIKIFNPNESGEGEVCFKGRNCFLGYFKNTQATLETVDAEGFIHSGDLGVIDKNGYLNITGRIKELIVTAGGENIPPIVVEDIFKTMCPHISNIMLVGDDRKYLVALLTLKADINLTNGAPLKTLLP
jgi:long-chain-fatty-acid--CoA ligase ACSBG